MGPENPEEEVTIVRTIKIVAWVDNKQVSEETARDMVAASTDLPDDVIDEMIRNGWEFRRMSDGTSQFVEYAGLLS